MKNEFSETPIDTIKFKLVKATEEKIIIICILYKIMRKIIVRL
jgi:hypothetical protein